MCHHATLREHHVLGKECRRERCQAERHVSHSERDQTDVRRALVLVQRFLHALAVENDQVENVAKETAGAYRWESVAVEDLVDILVQCTAAHRLGLIW